MASLFTCLITGSMAGLQFTLFRRGVRNKPMSKARMLSTSLALLIAALPIATTANGQTTLPFSIKIQQGTTVTNAGDGSSITFQADAIGRPTSAGIYVTHLGVQPANQPPTASPVVY